MRKLKQGSLNKLVMLTGIAVILGGCSGQASLDKEVISKGGIEVSSTSLMASERIQTVLAALEEAEKLAQGYFYDEAIEVLEVVLNEYGEVEIVSTKIEEYKEAKESFVPYTEPVRHIFFHSLIVDTSLAFDGDYMENGYNYWMTTVDDYRG